MSEDSGNVIEGEEPDFQAHNVEEAADEAAGRRRTADVIEEASEEGEDKPDFEGHSVEPGE